MLYFSRHVTPTLPICVAPILSHYHIEGLTPCLKDQYILYTLIYLSPEWSTGADIMELTPPPKSKE